MRELDFNNGRVAQQLHVWGYPVRRMLQEDWGNRDGYRTLVMDSDGEAVMAFGEAVVQINPWRNARHYDILFQIQLGEWPDTDDV